MSNWQYPSTWPAPPTPFVVITAPEYFVGTPTPPRPHVTHIVNDCTPCPPTPRCPSSFVHENVSNALNSGTSQSTSQPHQSTSLANPRTFLVSSNFDDQTQYDMAPHVSDSLLYDRTIYAQPSPVMAMIRRATLDMNGLGTQPVDPQACGQPRKLFSLTAGRIPLTGLEKQDQQSFDYYTMFPLPRQPGYPIPYCFSIGSIQALQHELRTEWYSVYPEPIPPVIIRSHDLSGYHCLNQRGVDGYAFVLPAENSIYSIVRQRGIDRDFRPINPSATVETRICIKGDGLYCPQHIVASKFAVNVFLELSATPLCQYLGAYVLQEVSDFTTEVPSLGCLSLLLVKFCYYKWDQCIIGLADKSRLRNFFAARQTIAHQAI
ncbi:hypothetical protein OG21DRAFT_1509754 [Imleria badia]|nr:hypothetical protein OG21DRAFT_1509754 [Imleria badia]